MHFPGPDKNKLTDSELIERFKKTDDKACIGVLFQRYSHLVYGLCLKHFKDQAESKDAVLSIFEKLMKELKRHDVKNFKAWLYMVSKNHCLMQLREKQAAIKKEINYIREEQSASVFEQELTTADLKELKLSHLEKAMDALKPEQKKCIELFYLKEMCYNEVAEQTGYNLKQVKSYIQNGKRNLKNILITQHESTFTS